MLHQNHLHNLFINIKGMTPAEFSDGGKGLSINYSFSESPFGNIIIASTEEGICYVAFYEHEAVALSALQVNFPNAAYTQLIDSVHQTALKIFTQEEPLSDQINLHVKATAFQLLVWQELLKIPFGQLTTYGQLAKNIHNPNATRAVGTAIGSNPVAFLIPCHRVIQASGKFGNYMWGSERKNAMIEWEDPKRHE